MHAPTKSWKKSKGFSSDWRTFKCLQTEVFLSFSCGVAVPKDLQLARCLQGVMEQTSPLHYFHWLSGQIVNERVGVLVQGFFILERMLHGGGTYTKVRVQFEHLLSVSRRHPQWRAATLQHSLSCIRQSVFNFASRRVFEVPADTWQILAFWRRNANSNWMNLLKTLYTQDFRDKTTRELIQSFQ